MAKPKILFNNREGKILTFTGRVLNVLDPDPASICIEDIGEGLSKQCRFTGQTGTFYSVGQHSVHGTELVPKDDKLWMLLHDASEAYISDFSRPLKYSLNGLGEAYKDIEARLMEAILFAFGLPSEPPESVEKADSMMVWAEWEDLMPDFPHKEKKLAGERYPRHIVGWEPWITRDRFFSLYVELTNAELRTSNNMYYPYRAIGQKGKYTTKIGG